MASVCFSYSHTDEELRDQLEVTLATLRRQDLIETWHDLMLRSGDKFDLLRCPRSKRDLAARGAPDPTALADLRDRYETDQLSTMVTRA